MEFILGQKMELIIILKGESKEGLMTSKPFKEITFLKKHTTDFVLRLFLYCCVKTYFVKNTVNSLSFNAFSVLVM